MTTVRGGVEAPTDTGAVVLACIAGAAGAFAGLTLIAMARNGWVFEYALDDVYIHLAMAEQIARGGYGVNEGELASAASSPLYPLLLTPFADTYLQRWLPLFWNILALVAAAALFALVIAKAGLGHIGALFAVIAPLALSMHVTAFTGMENMAHGVASLAIVLGLWQAVETDRIGWLLILGTILAPALRLEGLALALSGSVLVAFLGHPRAGLALMALAIFPVALFMGALTFLGLEPLPNSVVAKLADTSGGVGPLAKFAANTQTYGGRFLFVLSAALLLVGAMRRSENRRVGQFAFAIAAAGFAHLALGATGWMDRYENYAVISVSAALILASAGMLVAVRKTVAGAILLGGLVTYSPYALSVYAWNPTAISQQHGQMARFAKKYVKAPVAVNDLGYVAWQNPNYVLDLWGLASREALEIRSSTAPQGWAGPLAKVKGVEVAMIYDRWLEDAVPGTWTHLGTLVLDVPNAFLGGPEVAFYATEGADTVRLKAALATWETGLPPRARFIPAEDAE